MSEREARIARNEAFSREIRICKLYGWPQTFGGNA